MKRRELLRRSMMAGLGLRLAQEVRGGAPAEPPKVGERLVSRLNSWGKTELALSPEGPWTAVEPGDVFAGHQVLTVGTADGRRSWTALEWENAGSGEFVYVDRTGVVCRIRKPLGAVGRQIAPAIPTRSREYWDKLLAAEDDVLGKEYLADPRDPSLERTQQVYPPLIYPESYVGMKEYPHEVAVCWNGSIGVDKGFFTGKEPYGLTASGEVAPPALSGALSFALNGKEIEHEEALEVFRGQLDYSLPIAQFVYQRSSEQAGWEELVLMGRVAGKAALFLRFRLVNDSPEEKPVEFAVRLPVEGKLELTADRTKISITAQSWAYPGNGKPISNGSISATMVCEEAFEIADEIPVWRFRLAAGAHKDLYFVLPGDSPAPIRDSFFEALLAEYTDWQRFFNRGAQFDIPEPMIVAIAKGALAKCVVSVDGSEVRGGSVWYDGFWPFCTIYLSQVLLEFGYYEEVRRYVSHFMKTRIEPSGRFLMGDAQSSFQVFDTGDLLKLLANYYWYTRDATLIEEHKEQIDRVVSFIRQSRKESMSRFPEDDPRFGMVLGIMNNDWWADPPEYLYTNDAPIWQGLRDYAQALEALSAARGRKEYTAEAQELACYAKQYYKTLRKSFETAIDRKDGKIAFVHIHPVLDNPQPPLRCVCQTDKRRRANRRFHEWPRLLGTDLLTDEERKAIFDYEFEHEQTVMGVRRFVPEVLDNFQTYNASFQKLRLGMVREFLMEYYGHIHALLGPGMWSGFEQVQVVPWQGEKGRRNGDGEYLKGLGFYGLEGAHATWPIPRSTRQVFVFDEPDGQAIWVGRGIPRHWLTGGKTVAARRLPTRYGKLDLSYIYDVRTRTMTVAIDPIERRMIPEVRIGARAPELNLRLRSAACDPPRYATKVEPGRELVTLKNIDQPVSLRIRFDSGMSKSRDANASL